MTSSVKKGNQYEGEVKKYLESQGWTVEGQHRKVMFLGPGRMIMAGRDIFGCDLIAKKDGEKTHWIQVGTVSNKSAKSKQVIGKPWNFDGDIIQIWLRHSGKKRYDIYELLGNGCEFVGPSIVTIGVKNEDSPSITVEKTTSTTKKSRNKTG
jgi:hypothetical protein